MKAEARLLGAKKEGGMVAVKRRSILVGLGFLMFMGIAVYFRLWAIHYNISSEDTDLLRFLLLLLLLLDFGNKEITSMISMS